MDFYFKYKFRETTYQVYLEADGSSHSVSGKKSYNTKFRDHNNNYIINNNNNCIYLIINDADTNDYKKAKSEEEKNKENIEKQNMRS